MTEDSNAPLNEDQSKIGSDFVALSDRMQLSAVNQKKPQADTRGFLGIVLDC